MGAKWKLSAANVRSERAGQRVQLAPLKVELSRSRGHNGWGSCGHSLGSGR
jgi:hypothetical protein